MTRSIYIFVVKLIFSTIVYSQFLPYSALEFNDTNPDWQIVIGDSNVEDAIFFDGYNHFSFAGVGIHSVLVKDNVAYIPYLITKKYSVEGFEAFAIDLSNGSILWNNLVDLQSNEKQEFLITHEIDENNNYSLYSARRIKYPGNDFFLGNFAYFGDTSLLARRSYDLITGELIDSLILDNSLPSKAIIKHSLLNESSLYPGNDIINYLESNSSGDVIVHDLIDLEGRTIDSDTIRIDFKNDYGSQPISYNSGSSNIYQLSNDSIYILRFAYSDTSNIREATIRLYNSELEEKQCIDILSDHNLPIFKNMGIKYITNRHIYLSVSVLDAFGFAQSEIWIFNHSGDLMLRIPQEIDGSSYVSKAVTFDETLERFILFGFNHDTRDVDVFQNEGDSLIKKFTLEISNKDVFPVFHNILVLDNDRYLINFGLKNVNDNDDKQFWESMMLFSDVYSKFGLTTGTDESVVHNNPLKVFPNPSHGLLNIEGCELCEYKIYSSSGKLYKSGKVEDHTVFLKDKGVYLISFQIENKIISKTIIVN